jgi:hypothetical protein
VQTLLVKDHRDAEPAGLDKEQSLLEMRREGSRMREEEERR